MKKTNDARGHSWAIHVYPSELMNETRILRVTKTLTENRIFSRLLVVGTCGNTRAKKLQRPSSKVIFLRLGRLRAQKNLFNKVLCMILWTIKVACIAANKRPCCVNSHSLSSLPACLIIKLMTGALLIYEPHEIETETTETKGIRKISSKIIERLAMPFVDQLILTSEGHRGWYESVFPQVCAITVRNCPMIASAEESRPGDICLREELGLSTNQMLYLYHGALSYPRGVKVIIKAFEDLPDEFNILFMGSGPAEKEIRIKAKQNSNIHLLPLVHPSRVRFHAAQADAGIHMMDDSCINHLYALPNKPMEYMNARLPVIVSNVPEMRSLVDSAGSGWIVHVGDDVALAQLIRSLSRTDLKAKQQKSVIWAKQNNWEQEETRLIACYTRLFLS